MDKVEASKKQASAPDIAKVVERNIKTLVDRSRVKEEQRTLKDKISYKITGFIGNMAFIYFHLAFFICWFIWNKGLTPLHPFDPSFIGLSIVTSIEAFFLSAFVLISQNAMKQQSDQRDDLNLQVSLLAEHEVTKLITLVTAIAHKLEVDEASDPEMEALAKETSPEEVLDTIELQKGL